MRRRILLTTLAIAVTAVLVVGVPAAVADANFRAVIITLCAVAIVAAAAAAAVQSRALTRPVAELAEAADRLRSGDPRPIGRRYRDGRA